MMEGKITRIYVNNHIYSLTYPLLLMQCYTSLQAPIARDSHVLWPVAVILH
jgi:hypothetical protein